MDKITGKGNRSKPRKVLSWNVNGYSNPLGPITRSVSARIDNPPSYVPYLRNFDVVTLQETWLKENPFVELMPDYQWVHIPSRDPEGTRGRKRGGFIIGWRRSIPSRNVRSQLVGHSEWGSVELYLFGRWVQIVGLYRHHTTKFKDINLPFNRAIPILLMGDMNTRTGNTQTSSEIPRESRDSRSSPTSSAFMKWLEANGLDVLNGSVEGDVPGQITRIGTRGGQPVESCIDYAVGNKPMMDLVQELYVDKNRRESDHSPLIVTLAVDEDDDNKDKKEKDDRKHDIERIKQKEKEKMIKKEKKEREDEEKRERVEREQWERFQTALTVGVIVVGTLASLAVAAVNPSAGILTGKAAAKAAAAVKTAGVVRTVAKTALECMRI